MPNRDDFAKATIGTLARRVNLRCSNPDYHKLTGGPGTEPAGTGIDYWEPPVPDGSRPALFSSA